MFDFIFKSRRKKHPGNTLIEVRKLLTEDTWIKGCLAMDSNNNVVSPIDKNARKWCLVGAICKVKLYTTPADGKILELLQEAILEYKGNMTISPSTFNDSPRTTLADVHAVLDLAISKA